MGELLSEFRTRRLLDLDFLDAPLPQVAAQLAARAPGAPFAYVITPNADHLVRLARNAVELQPYYRSAGALLMDSRVVRGMCVALGLPCAQVVTGSDLTLELLTRWIDPAEPITIIGTTEASVLALRRRFSLTRVAHLAPPFGFESQPAVIEQCVEYVRLHPARFVFLACGAPRQELLAYRIAQAGGATGIGLCIGAAVDQIGGLERRAPAWMRAAGLEWSWRLMREPNRMGRRYLQDLAVVPALMRERQRAARR